MTKASIITSIMTQATIMTPLWHPYDTPLYPLWQNICTQFIGMRRQQSFIWTAGNDNQPTKMFGVWFQPTDRRTAIMGSSSCDMSDTIIHIICSIIQFMTVVQPVLQQL